MDCLISWSGGLDSTALLIQKIKEGFNINTISFDYDQKNRIEIDLLKKNILYLKTKGIKINHREIDLTSAFKNIQSKNYVIPNRNTIFSSILYAHAISLSNNIKPVEISLGVNGGDYNCFPDCRPDFYKNLISALEIGNVGNELVSFLLPYIEMKKSQIIKEAIDNCNYLNLDWKVIFGNTITSYEPNKEGVSNGRTPSDIDRILAFNELDLIDPILYVKDWDIILEHALAER